MKIAVLVKRVPDTASVFKIGADGASVVLDGLKFVMSPYDEYAMEAAIQLKEKVGAEVVVVCAGPDEAKETIRSGLAMGADSGVLIQDAALDKATSRGVSVALAAAVKAVGADLVLAGKQAVDDDASQTPERVAELLAWPHASVVTKLELAGTTVSVHREIEGGHLAYDMPLPAVLTVDKALNTPRYPTLPNIMKAKKKPIEEKTLVALGVGPEAVASDIAVTGMALPRQQRLCKVFKGKAAENVKELVSALRDVEKVF